MLLASENYKLVSSQQKLKGNVNLIIGKWSMTIIMTIVVNDYKKVIRKFGG